MARATYGPEIQSRSRLLLKKILLFSLGELDGCERSKVKFTWEATQATLRVDTTLRDLAMLTKGEETEALTVPQVRESLSRMEDFLGIFQDDRLSDRGSARWNFKLNLWAREVDRNLVEFDKLWDSKRSPDSKAKVQPEVVSKSGMKPGAPLPGVRLPDNFVARTGALEAVDRKSTRLNSSHVD